MPFTRKNHYVPQHYLKRFADEDGRLNRYRVLVSNGSVSPWKPMHVAGVGYQSNLYTRTVPSGDSDEIEQWLSRDFETPAERTLARVINGDRLYREDYRTLTRFAAAQMVRTPAFLIKNLPRWQSEAEKQSRATLSRLEERLKRKKVNAPITPSIPKNNAKYYPLKISEVPSEDSRKVGIKLQTIVGRATWIFAIKHILTETVERLTAHGWTIIHAAENLPWFTSDDPLVCLNFRSETDYNFEGGWGVPHTNIFLPLSPRHLLFSQVGDKRLPNGTIFPDQESRFIRRLIAEHAHRYIFSQDAEMGIEKLRPRHVDGEAVRNEANSGRSGILSKAKQNVNFSSCSGGAAGGSSPGDPSSRRMTRIWGDPSSRLFHRR